MRHLLEDGPVRGRPVSDVWKPLLLKLPLDKLTVRERTMLLLSTGSYISGFRSLANIADRRLEVVEVVRLSWNELLAEECAKRNIDPAELDCARPHVALVTKLRHAATGRVLTVGNIHTGESHSVAQVQGSVARLLSTALCSVGQLHPAGRDHAAGQPRPGAPRRHRRGQDLRAGRGPQLPHQHGALLPPPQRPAVQAAAARPRLGGHGLVRGAEPGLAAGGLPGPRPARPQQQLPQREGERARADQL